MRPSRDFFWPACYMLTLTKPGTLVDLTESKRHPRQCMKKCCPEEALHAGLWWTLDLVGRTDAECWFSAESSDPNQHDVLPTYGTKRCHNMSCFTDRRFSANTCRAAGSSSGRCLKAPRPSSSPSTKTPPRKGCEQCCHAAATGV